MIQSLKNDVSKWIQIFFVSSVIFFGTLAGENILKAGSPDDEGITDVVNPHNSSCYDWRGSNVPCLFKRQYAELLQDKPIPASRFVDNQNGTVTDFLTNLIWLKNPDCFGKMMWGEAVQAVKTLKAGDCGSNPDLVLSDGSSAGDWRLPTMSELCTLIDFSQRDPALPQGHKFGKVRSVYHWSATTLDHYSGMAWIVYIESGTTCYEHVKNRAGHVWPVRGPLE